MIHLTPLQSPSADHNIDNKKQTLAGLFLILFNVHQCHNLICDSGLALVTKTEPDINFCISNKRRVFDEINLDVCAKQLELMKDSIEGLGALEEETEERATIDFNLVEAR